jgi:hypothetical protein
MPDVQEVFRMTTQKVRPDPGFVDRQYDHRRKQERKRKIGALAVAAVIGMAAVALFLGTRGGQDRTTTPAVESPITAEEVATGFLEAYGGLDADRAITYLADEVSISELTGGEGTLQEFRPFVSWLEAGGYVQVLDPCEEQGSSSAGTRVRCTFDFHFLRSDEIGLGPYTGSSFDLVVRDDEIVRVSLYWELGEFSPQMWEPFAAWVSENYPEDAAVMYEDESYSLERRTEESIRLWERHTREYVEEVQAGGQ